MKNSGKQFEENFKKSVPSDVHVYRFKDSTASFDGAKTKFAIYNSCDFEIFHGGNLYWLELKSHKGASLPLGCVRDTQVKELTKASNKGVICGLLTYFSDKKRVFWLDINDYNDFVNDNDRKSIPISYFEEEGIEVDVKMLSVNIRLDIKKFLSVFE